MILVTIKSAVPMAQLNPPKTMAYRNDPWLSAMICPPIGEPVNAAIAAIEKTVPERIPISCMGETCAQSAGVRPIPAPELIPKNAAKTMSAAFPVAGSHNARMRIVVKPLITIMTLNRPTLSAMAFGTVRPITLGKISYKARASATREH